MIVHIVWQNPVDINNNNNYNNSDNNLNNGDDNDDDNYDIMIIILVIKIIIIVIIIIIIIIIIIKIIIIYFSSRTGSPPYHNASEDPFRNGFLIPTYIYCCATIQCHWHSWELPSSSQHLNTYYYLHWIAAQQ